MSRQPSDRRRGGDTINDSAAVIVDLSSSDEEDTITLAGGGRRLPPPPLQPNKGAGQRSIQKGSAERTASAAALAVHVPGGRLRRIPSEESVVCIGEGAKEVVVEPATHRPSAREQKLEEPVKKLEEENLELQNQLKVANEEVVYQRQKSQATEELACATDEKARKREEKLDDRLAHARAKMGELVCDNKRLMMENRRLMGISCHRRMTKYPAEAGFFCECGWTFRRAESLQLHLQQYSTSGGVFYKCEYEDSSNPECSVLFWTPDAWYYHMAEVHHLP